MVGSHNSYKLAPVPAVAEAIEAFVPVFAASIDYSHLPLAQQLEDHGIRQLELDVYADPEGGLYADRNLLSIIGQPTESGVPELEQPGFKVMHIQDVDFETTCVTLVVCLEAIEAWSTTNPDHAPLLIMIETKTEGLTEAAVGFGFDLSTLGVETVEPPKMTEGLFEDLEAEVLSVFARERIITPDEIRGEHETLDAAVRQSGWPTLEDSRGRLIFVLLDMGESTAVYTASTPALEGRLFFTSATLGAPDGAFVRFGDPVADAAQIREALEAGYLVRTRADADTVEARSGDVTRRDAALAGGAQYVSTDYYVADPDLDPDYVVALPGGTALRCNPVTAEESCSSPAG